MIQALYEAAMYIFVLQWPPAVSAAITAQFGSAVATPYGLIFSCFMASCLLGSTLFGKLVSSVPAPKLSLVLTSIAAVSMSVATYCTTFAAPPLLPMIAALFAFEATVGCYFPTIGTLRSKFVPESQRSVIYNIFGVPLNMLVVGVFLSINFLGIAGALTISTGALATAALLSWELSREVAGEVTHK